VARFTVAAEPDLKIAEVDDLCLSPFLFDPGEDFPQQKEGVAFAFPRTRRNTQHFHTDLLMNTHDSRDLPENPYREEPLCLRESSSVVQG
jgi:hypothetical protein